LGSSVLRTLFAFIAILAGIFPVQGQTNDLALCADLSNAEAAMAACTRIIEAGQAPVEELARAYSLRSQHQVSSSNADAALADHNAAVRLREKASEARTVADFINRAVQDHSNSNWKAAIADATAALRIDPSSAAAYNVRGDALAQLREFDRAIMDLSEAIQIEPTMRVAYINRGAAYEESGRNELALADYDTAILRQPEWEVGYRKRYELLIKLGRYAEAIPSMTKRSELLPRHVYILAERAEAYRAMQDFERAFADYNEAIKRSPKDGRFWQGRARLHHERGDDQSALG
jgi:tetratricopeptide (TPR) repeat protein